MFDCIFGCTVCVFNIVLERLVSCLFCPDRRLMSVFSKSTWFFVKWGTITAVVFSVLQHAGVTCLSFLLRFAARGSYR